MDFLHNIYTFIKGIDFTPMRSIIDLNDIRNIAAISGVIITLFAASKKWGNKAIYYATISKTLNRPTRITSLSIANLKDKPLIIYELHIRFNNSKHYFCLQKFEPPIVIKGLEATTVEPDAYSSLSIEPNPFDDLDIDMDLFLVTERAVVKCKEASPPGSLVRAHMKNFSELTKSKLVFNKKIYTSDTAYALIYKYEGKQRTSFLLKRGFIYDDWPFHINALPSNAMSNNESLVAALDALSTEISTKINIVKLS